MKASWDESDFTGLLSLYDAVGWAGYTKDPQALKTAYLNYSYVLLCLDGGEVVGALRSISDDVSIHYLQDLLVKPSHQRRGIGRRLVEGAKERYSHVRTHLLLTDNEERQARF